jgi:hypothetical protein
MDNKVIAKKGKDNWYPTYAPHIILGSNKSYLDEIYQTMELWK